MAETESKNVQAVVIGAGVVGLCTATLLQEVLPGAQVTVIAEKFGQDTTSDGAAGIFRPGLQFRGEDKEDAMKWLADSYAYYKRIAVSDEAVQAGVRKLSGYHFSDNYPSTVKNPLLEKLLDEYRPCTEEELRLHGHKYGSFMTTLLTECRLFLPYLTKKFTGRGGKLVRRHLDSLEEVAGYYDVVCNCTGFGAKELCHDLNLTPIRGQVYKVRAPWIKLFYFVDYDTYIIPGMELVTLGGVRNFDSYNAEVDKHDSAAIWERCVEEIPSLKDAEVVREWVGWRPYRHSVRVEKEIINFPSGKTLKVVHNYGHGGFGVMSAPGTSMHAVKLAVEMLRGHKEHQAKL